MARDERFPAKPKTNIDIVRGERPSSSHTDLVTWPPFDFLWREMDRAFVDYPLNPFRLFPRLPSLTIDPFGSPKFSVALPAIDLVEFDKGFELTAEMPGLDEKNIEVSLSKGILTIKGYREDDGIGTSRGFHVRERRVGAFERSLRVPDTVAMEKIEATFKNGVLTVTLPKNPLGSTTKIDIHPVGFGEPVDELNVNASAEPLPGRIKTPSGGPVKPPAGGSVRK